MEANVKKACIVISIGDKVFVCLFNVSGSIWSGIFKKRSSPDDVLGEFSMFDKQTKSQKFSLNKTFSTIEHIKYIYICTCTCETHREKERDGAKRVTESGFFLWMFRLFTRINLFLPRWMCFVLRVVWDRSWAFFRAYKKCVKWGRQCKAETNTADYYMQVLREGLATLGSSTINNKQISDSILFHIDIGMHHMAPTIGKYLFVQLFIVFYRYAARRNK